MGNQINVNDQIITKYLTGEATPEEAMAVHDWMVEPQNKAYFEKAETVWHSTHPAQKPSSFDKKEAFRIVESQMTISSNASSVRMLNFKLFSRIAAVFIVGVCLAAIGYSVFNKIYSPTILSSGDVIKNVQLPDSSEVILSQNSEVKYSWRFGSRLREIDLSGEAYFKVQHNKDKPFVIHTPVASVKVTGTAFNVSIINDELEVNVNEGEVLVYTLDDSCYIKAGQKAIVHEGITHISLESIADINSWSYATRKFVFNDTPLKQVFHYFKKAYPNYLKVRDKRIENCKLTATFDDISAEYMLTLIAETLDLRLIKDDNTFTLEGEGCP